VRTKGDYEQWLSFFLDGVIQTSQDALEDSRKILHLREKHQKLLWRKKVASPQAVVLLEKLFYTPLMGIAEVQKELKLSHQSASNLVTTFEKVGILKEITGKKRGRRFAYTEYLAILSEGTKPL